MNASFEQLPCNGGRGRDRGGGGKGSDFGGGLISLARGTVEGAGLARTPHERSFC